MTDTRHGLSSFDIYAIVYELQNLLEGYIERIYQLDKESLLIRVKKKGGLKESLFIRNTELICRTNHQFNVPEKPSLFAMTLRKYLINGTITGIEQYDFDRVIIIKITKNNKIYSLILELFKNGNIILVDQDGTILQPLLTQRWSHRTIKTHEPYKPPAINQVNPLSITLDEFRGILKKSNKDLVRTLAVTLNMSGLYAEELCHRAGVDKNLDAESIDDDTLRRLYSELQGLIEPFRGYRFQPVIIRGDDDKTIHILPIMLETLRGYNHVMVESFTLALQELIDRKTSGEVDRYDELLEKLKRKLEQQRRSRDEFIKLKEEKQHEAEILYRYTDSIQGLLDDINQVIKQKDKTESIEQIKNNRLVKEFNLEDGRVTLILEDENKDEHEVTIDIRMTVMENASAIYDEVKKYKEKIKGAEDAIKATMDEIKNIETEKKKFTAKEEEVIEKAPKKTFWFERYRWSISTNGNLIIGGRDAKTNDQVVKKHLKPDDRYIHADIHGAPSCIVKSEDIHGKPLPIDEKTLEEAAVFAACYSKAWKRYGDVNVYWVYPEQVSKTPPTGEYLPKGSFMIRGERHYYRCRLEAAIGEVTLDGVKKIMLGSPDTISRYSKRYAVITPGDIKSSSIAKTLSKVFDTTPDEVLRILPPGDIKITKTVGFTLQDEMMRQ